MKYPILRTCLLASALATTLAATAQKIDFGKIGSGEDAFRQYWGLSAEESRRYHNYMEIAGKYRHKDTSPLLVLSMITDDPEEKSFYALKAAQYEHDMVKREIQAAWMLSRAMSEEKLADAMTEFTDDLTGVNTRDYIPLKERREREEHWQVDDMFIIYVDGRCMDVDCLTSFREITEKLPEGVTNRRLVVKGGAPEDKVATQKSLEAVQLPGVTLRLYDPIEYSYLGDTVLNRALHIRDGKVVRILTGFSEHHIAQPEPSMPAAEDNPTQPEAQPAADNTNKQGASS